jgi:hypothetical protein
MQNGGFAVTLNVGDPVEVLRDLNRAEGPYAKKGERGVVEEIFRPVPTASLEKKKLAAKVRMTANGRIKTFRLTSIQKVN